MKEGQGQIILHGSRSVSWSGMFVFVDGVTDVRKAFVESLGTRLLQSQTRYNTQSCDALKTDQTGYSTQSCDALATDQTVYGTQSCDVLATDQREYSTQSCDALTTDQTG